MNEFLEMWFQDVPAGAYGYSWQFPGGRFSNAAVRELEGLQTAIRVLEEDEAQGVWFRCTTLAEVPMSGRGTAEDTLAVPGVWADVDVAGPGHKHSGLPATEEDALAVLERSGMPEPTAVLRTGGGISAWWKYDEPLFDLERASQISKHVHELLKAGSPGVKIDNVSDLARVMRAPGTTNRKPGVNVPCVLASIPGRLYPLTPKLYAPEVFEGLVVPAPAQEAEIYVARATSLLDDLNFSSGQRERTFSKAEAKAFVRPALERLERAQDGEINVSLNNAAKCLSHFGTEFWPREDAEFWLQRALSHTEYDGTTWKADDTIRSGLKPVPGDWVAERLEPAERPVEPEFTDASMAEYLAGEVIRDRFVRTRGLGWLRWTGTIWSQCDDGAPVEAVRAYVKKRLIKAIKAEAGSVRSWAKYNSAGKISSLVGLAGNIAGCVREAEEFDQHPDLLNTPAGVLDLNTLSLSEHSPELLLTKITKGSYRPEGKQAEAFTTALEAVPEGARAWLQVHFGAGVSGRPKPRVPLVLLTGVGRNGKTLLCEAALEALGGISGTGYAVQVPNELLLLGKATGGPSPEKLALRGARFAYVEETPEGRYLDVNALKKVVGTGVMSGRSLYKDLVQFRMTHIMFLNTNYPPRVSETDTATWDRLTSLRFPYRYRKGNDTLGEWLETDRAGSPTLAEEMLAPEALDAMLTWMVDGYRAGRTDEVATPEDVLVSTKEWRKEGDALLRFLEDVFVFDEASWVTSGALYAALKRWSEVQGQQKPPPMNTFISRLKGHTGLEAKIVTRRVLSTTPGLSVPTSAEWVVEGGESRAPETQQARAVIGLRFRTRDDA